MGASVKEPVFPQVCSMGCEKVHEKVLCGQESVGNAEVSQVRGFFTEELSVLLLHLLGGGRVWQAVVPRLQHRALCLGGQSPKSISLQKLWEMLI